MRQVLVLFYLDGKLPVNRHFACNLAGSSVE